MFDLLLIMLSGTAIVCIVIGAYMATRNKPRSKIIPHQLLKQRPPSVEPEVKRILIITASFHCYNNWLFEHREYSPKICTFVRDPHELSGLDWSDPHLRIFLVDSYWESKTWEDRYVQLFIRKWAQAHPEWS